MAGKITYKKGVHPSRIGSFVEGFDLSPPHRATLAGYIGQPITDSGAATIEDFVEYIRSLNDGDERVTTQDVRATLAAIGNSKAGAVKALQNCDSLTEAQIHNGLRKIGIYDFSAPTSNQIRAAALLALADLGEGTNGRPHSFHRSEFYNGVVKLWHDVGGTDDAAWEDWEGGTTPLVLFATYLLQMIEPDTCPGYSTIAKSIRKVVA